MTRMESSNLYDILQYRMYSEQTPDDGQMNFPKHVEFHAGVNLGNWCIWLVLFVRMHGHMNVKQIDLLTRQ
jgi:hypothetical protein